MNRLAVLGAGTAGTMVVNRLRRRLPRSQWQITLVEPSDRHFYQPGYLFLPFGGYTTHDIVRSTHQFVPEGVDLRYRTVEEVSPDDGVVRLSDGERLPYDYLVIATGVQPRPEQTEGMLDGGEWRRSIFDFYTFTGAGALARALGRFEGGRLVVHTTEMPIKCPVAPLEFAFLADDWLRRRGLRERTELVFATPLPGAFTRPVAAGRLGAMLDERKILVEPEFPVERVEKRTLIGYDGREIPFDLLVTVPVNMGADYIARSGLGNELNLVRVDRQTLRSADHPNIFVLGDAADLPSSKAGSVAHFQAEIFTGNFLRLIRGAPMTGRFDGHANCFVESGRGRALLIDFNYDTEPLPGRYPVPGLGPFRLLGESVVNHLGKRAFRWAYWNLLLPGRPLPVPVHMSMAGKRRPHPEE
jgi:sulfide:quinone oxidoreductase